MAKAKKTDKQGVKRRSKPASPLAPLSPHGKRMLEQVVRTGKLTAYGRRQLQSTEEGRRILAAGGSERGDVKTDPVVGGSERAERAAALDNLAVDIGTRPVVARARLSLSRQNLHDRSNQLH